MNSTVITTALACDLIARSLEDTGHYRVLRRLPKVKVLEGDAIGNVKMATIIDTETTGLDIATVKITEIGMRPIFYDEKTLQIVGAGQRYTALQDPGEPLSDEVKRVTHMTDEMLKGQSIDWSKVASIIFNSHLLIAQNAAFDRPIVERHLRTHVPQLQDTLEVCLSQAWADPKSEIPWQQMGFPSTSQTAIATHLGYFYEAHRAMQDVDALAGILSLAAPAIVHQSSILFQILLKSARLTSYRIFATGSPFDAKDKLKARSYSWDAGLRVWYRDIRDNTHANDELSPVDQERIWLKENAGVRDARVTEMTARTRYK